MYVRLNYKNTPPADPTSPATSAIHVKLFFKSGNKYLLASVQENLLFLITLQKKLQYTYIEFRCV